MKPNSGVVVVDGCLCLVDGKIRLSRRRCEGSLLVLGVVSLSPVQSIQASRSTLCHLCHSPRRDSIFNHSMSNNIKCMLYIHTSHIHAQPFFPRCSIESCSDVHMSPLVTGQHTRARVALLPLPVNLRPGRKQLSRGQTQHYPA